MIERWLALLCQLLPGVVRAVVVRRDGSVWSQWPEAVEIDTLRAFCAAGGKSEAVRYQDMSELTQVAMPLYNGKVRVGSVAVELPLKASQRSTTELLLRWSQAWLEALTEAGRGTQRGSERMLQVLEQAGRFADLSDNASALATALVDQFGFTRALICLPWRGQMRVTGVSHSPTFDRRSDMFNLLESHLQQLSKEAQSLPQDSEYTRWLSTRQPSLQALLITLGEAGYCVLLYPPEAPPDSATKAQCRQIARLVAPFFHSQNQLRQGVFWRVRERIWGQYRDANRRAKWQWAAGIAIVLGIFLALPGQHRVTAQANLEGKVQRAIVAPEEGYLQEANVKAGEIIRQGQVLAQLDSKSIQLEIQRWQGEKQEYERQYNRELTALNPVEMRIAKAKMSQAEAQLNLYRERLRRVRITAPIDGVVIKGDLSRAVGSPVQRGQVLYEIAPLDAFKLVIQVPQKAIRHLHQGQSGKVLLSSLPHDAIAFTITSVASVYSEHEQDIVYRVEAEIADEQQSRLRPGMSGYAKIDVGKKPYGWLIAHPLLDWLALKVWRL